MRVPVAIVVVLVVVAFGLGWFLRGSGTEPERALGGAVATVDATSTGTSTRAPRSATSTTHDTPAPPGPASQGLTRAPSAPIAAAPTTARALGATNPTTTAPQDRGEGDAVGASPTADGPEVEPERMVWSVDREGIQGAVREALPDIRECYIAWLRDNPALAGKLTVRFTIEAAGDGGEVTSAALVSSDIEHPLMEGCVLNVMRELAFESPGDEPTTVSYPIVLATDE